MLPRPQKRKTPPLKEVVDPCGPPLVQSTTPVRQTGDRPSLLDGRSTNQGAEAGVLGKTEGVPRVAGSSEPAGDDPAEPRKVRLCRYAVAMSALSGSHVASPTLPTVSFFPSLRDLYFFFPIPASRQPRRCLHRALARRGPCRLHCPRTTSGQNSLPSPPDP